MSSKNSVKESDQNLLICVRIRPFTEEERKLNASRVCHRVDEKVITLVDPIDGVENTYNPLRCRRNRNREYAFDNVFDGKNSQEDVFQSTTSFLISHVANGYNATVFASGATGSGKTYTMVGTGMDPGIMVRSMEELFAYMSNTSEEYTYRVSMAYMELYNEVLRDLLNPEPEMLELREDAKGLHVNGLRELEPTTRYEVFKLLERGNLNRTTEPTAANKTSSRSHAILQITVRQTPRTRSIHDEVHVGKLFLVDLAGSERASKTLNRGKRMTEGAHINRSLLALGNCINALADTNGRRYVNYRDSKLTRLLKDALVGNCRTVMLTHISPSNFHFEETRNTLVYADRAKSIKTKVRQNVIDVNLHISQYTQLIQELREEITRLKENLSSASIGTAPELHAVEINQLKDALLTAFSEHLQLRRKLVHLTDKLLKMELKESCVDAFTMDPDAFPGVAVAKGTEGGGVDDGGGGGGGRGRLLEEFGYSLDNNYLETCGSRVISPINRLSGENRLKLEEEKKRVVEAHEAAAKKVAKLKVVLLRLITKAEEKEIIDLMVRLHDVELDRADLGAQYACSGTELLKRELLLSQVVKDNRLSEAIIRYQAGLLAHNKVEKPRELELLLEIYSQQAPWGAGRRTSLSGSSVDVRMVKNAEHRSTVQHLPEKISNSMSCIPSESSTDGSGRQSRQAYHTRDIGAFNQIPNPTPPRRLMSKRQPPADRTSSNISPGSGATGLCYTPSIHLDSSPQYNGLHLDRERFHSHSDLDLSNEQNDGNLKSLSNSLDNLVPTGKVKIYARNNAKDEQDGFSSATEKSDRKLGGIRLKNRFFPSRAKGKHQSTPDEIPEDFEVQSVRQYVGKPARGVTTAKAVTSTASALTLASHNNNNTGMEEGDNFPPLVGSPLTISQPRSTTVILHRDCAPHPYQLDVGDSGMMSAICPVNASQAVHESANGELTGTPTFEITNEPLTRAVKVTPLEWRCQRPTQASALKKCPKKGQVAQQLPKSKARPKPLQPIPLIKGVPEFSQAGWRVPRLIKCKELDHESRLHYSKGEAHRPLFELRSNKLTSEILASVDKRH